MKSYSSPRRLNIGEDRPPQTSDEFSTAGAARVSAAERINSAELNLRALIVDPDVAHRRAVGDVLREHGWEVHEVETLAQAMEVIDCHSSVPLVFCDAQLASIGDGALGGLTLLGELKRRLGTATHIVVTAAQDAPDAPWEAIIPARQITCVSLVTKEKSESARVGE